MLVVIKCNKTFKLTIFKDRDHWRYLLDKYLISNNFTTAYYKVFQVFLLVLFSFHMTFLLLVSVNYNGLFISSINK